MEQIKFSELFEKFPVDDMKLKKHLIKVLLGTQAVASEAPLDL